MSGYFDNVARASVHVPRAYMVVIADGSKLSLLDTREGPAKAELTLENDV